jgi:hypothetical protein
LKLLILKIIELNPYFLSGENMEKKKILILALAAFILVSMVIESSTAYPTKYKTKVFTSNYAASDSYFDDDYDGEGVYIWTAKKSKNAIYSNSAIIERFYGNKTKVTFRVYNNNGNKFHHTDCRSAKITFNYKINTFKDKEIIKSVKKSKTFSYNKIPKYGFSKTITLNSSKNTEIHITSIKFSQTHRMWY